MDGVSNAGVGMNMLAPEAGLEPAQGCPYRILSHITSVTTTHKPLQQPIISTFTCIGVRRALEVSCSKTRTKDGRKTAVVTRSLFNARRMFSPARLFNTL